MMIVARGNNARIKEFFRNKHNNKLNDGQLESSSDLGGEELNYKHF
jgi:hypothetical protein